LCEFKCLKATNHIKAHIYHKKTGKAPTDYISQCQMQMFVTGRKWTDLVFFHPSLPELIIRIEADLAFHKVLESQLKAVIIERDKIVKLLRES
jgi:DNA topoisomerase IB